MSTISSETAILVTGASGYVASWIIKQLLEEGRTVHGTVRSLAKEHKVKHLLQMGEAHPNQLQLFEADLLKEGSFEKAMQGCELVIHTASPFIRNAKDPQKELIDPALKGTRNVLNSVNATESVKKVVLTSSVVAIYGDAIDTQQMKDQLITTKYWNTSSSLKHQPYSYSKTLAEKEAWKLMEAQDRWTMVTIHPALVLGPSLSERVDGESMDFMLNMLNGKLKSGVPELYFGIVDVRDVAQAHIRAGLNDQANGRYIACGHDSSMPEIAKILGKHYGNQYPVPKRTAPKWLLYIIGPGFGITWKYINKNVGIPLHFDNHRTKEDLGIDFRPLEETLSNHAQYILDKGLLDKNS